MDSHDGFRRSRLALNQAMLVMARVQEGGCRYLPGGIGSKVAELSVAKGRVASDRGIEDKGLIEDVHKRD
jgi:hypothetical protein